MDWRDILPIEAFAPVIGGVLLWFGFNYVYIAPEVLGPRLAAKYYAPACKDVVSVSRRERAIYLTQRSRTQDTALAAVRTGVQNQIQQAMPQMPPAYQEFFRHYGNPLETAASATVAQKVREFQMQLDAANAAEDREARANVIHSSPDAFCGCIVGKATAQRTEMALYTASLRLYEPDVVKRLLSGAQARESADCGKMPVG